MADTLTGDARDNSIYGLGGADQLFGGEGNDYLSGGDADDALNGGPGNDLLDGGNGNDSFVGGDGVDTVMYASAPAGVHVHLGLSDMQDTGGGGSDSFRDFIENLRGSAFDDALTGDETANGISGGDGADRLTGGGGADTFKDTAAGLNGDTITDFGPDDRIVISDANLAGFSANLSGQILTYTGGSLTLGKPLPAAITASAAPEGGVRLTIGPYVQFRGVDAFDINALNLNWHYVNSTAISLQKNVNAQLDGTIYPDAFGVRAFDSSSSRELDFLGSGFALDANNNVTAGMVNVISEFTLQGSYFLWLLEGVSLSAVELYNAALTPSNQDEINLIQTALSGNNVITLGSGNDRMSGFTGDDVITGGLGADVLSGGTGNDTFIDTLAGLNGDTITDFGLGDTIIITDVNLANFAFTLSGSHLNFGGTLTLDNLPQGHIVAQAALGGGVQLTLAPATVHNDFNGDRVSDVLWRTDSGYVTNWTGHSYGFGGALFTFSASSNWQIAGTGDFNGDGRVDIMWRASDGTVTDWLAQANGSFSNNFANFSVNASPNWNIVSTGDFNGDGKDDILWRGSNGQVSTWPGTASGSFDPAHSWLSSADTSWHVLHPLL